MKRMILFLLALAFSSFSLNLNAQNFSDKVAAAKLIMIAAGYEIADTYEGYYKKDEYVYKYRNMYKGMNYAVMIVSENGVYDTDVYLYRDGTRVDYNNSSNDEGITYIEYSPWLTSRYKVEAHNIDSYGSYSYRVAIIIGYY